MRIPVAALAIVGVLLSPALVSAQQVPAVAPTALVESSASSAAPSPLLPSSHLQRGGLVALSASLVSLPAYDAYSTLSALKLGGTESNPLMQGVVRHPAALILLKGGVTASSIFAATHLWQQHHRGAAIALLAVTNGTMAAVAAHNASALRTWRAGGN
jgi:hypothetical protein